MSRLMSIQRLMVAISMMERNLISIGRWTACFVSPRSPMILLKTQENWFHPLRWIHVDNFFPLLDVMLRCTSIFRAFSSAFVDHHQLQKAWNVKLKKEKWRLHQWIGSFYSPDCLTAARNYWKHFYRVPILRLMDFIVISHQLRVTRNALMKFPQTWRTRPLDFLYWYDSQSWDSRASFQVSFRRRQFEFTPAKCQTMGIQHRKLFMVRKTAMTFESRLGRRRKNFSTAYMHPGAVLLTCGGINATYCHGLISKLTSSASLIVVEGVSVTPKSFELEVWGSWFKWSLNFFATNLSN